MRGRWRFDAAPVEPLRVLPRWRSPEIACSFVVASRRDRETLAWSTAGLLLTVWALTGGSFCFRRKGGRLHIGLVKTPTPRRPTWRQRG